MGKGVRITYHTVRFSDGPPIVDQIQRPKDQSKSVIITIKGVDSAFSPITCAIAKIILATK